MENEDSCAEFDLKGLAQSEPGDQTNDSGLAVQKGLKRDPSPGKSGRLVL